MGAVTACNIMMSVWTDKLCPGLTNARRSVPMVSSVVQSETSLRPRLLTQILVLCGRLNYVGQLVDVVQRCLRSRSSLACGMVVRFRQIGTVHFHSLMEKVFGSTPATYTYRVVSQLQRIVLWIEISKLRTGSHGQCSANGDRQLLFFKFKICKSVNYHKIQINHPTKCNNFSSLLLDIYLQLNMFRASSRPSSEAQQLQ